jgi:hypothetical protein
MVVHTMQAELCWSRHCRLITRCAITRAAHTVRVVSYTTHRHYDNPVDAPVVLICCQENLTVIRLCRTLQCLLCRQSKQACLLAWTGGQGFDKPASPWLHLIAFYSSRAHEVPINRRHTQYKSNVLVPDF